MNKKFLSAILFGALMVSSTGTFVSCKDYDDDIDNLQEQIDKLATKEDMSSQIATLQAALTTAAKDASDALAKATAAEAAAKAAGDTAAAAKAQVDKAAAEAKAAAIEAAKAEVEKAKAELQKVVEAGLAENKAEMDKLRKEISEATKKVEEIVGKIADMVTSVELVVAHDNAGQFKGQTLKFMTAIEKDNVFGKGLAGEMTFTQGTQVQTGDAFVVRVSPTNAVLTVDMISLIDGEGNNLNEFLTVESVEPFNQQIVGDEIPSTRAVSQSGLWKVTVALKNYDKDAFVGTTQVESNGKTHYKRFAVEVNNTKTTAATREVVSSFDLQLGKTDFKPVGELNYWVGDKNVTTIRNRYATTESQAQGGLGIATNQEELKWKDTSKPQTSVKRNGDGTLHKDSNAEKDANDDRSSVPYIYPAVQGVPFTISIDEMNNITLADIKAPAQVKGLYVTLDTRNAIESAPSELNAWNSYQYTGLNAVVEGTSTQITIDGANIINDIIGFRVFAVNYDGTLVDPDGKAFYVKIGKEGVTLPAFNTTVVATDGAYKPDGIASNIVELTKEQVAMLKDLKATKYEWYADGINNKNTKTALSHNDANGFGLSLITDKMSGAFITSAKDVAEGMAVTDKFAAANLAGISKVAISTKFNHGLKYVMNGTKLNGKLVLKNADDFVVATINVTVEKTLPTTAPADDKFAPKANQIVNGVYNCFLLPGAGYDMLTNEPKNENGTWTLEGVATSATMDMTHVFTGWSSSYEKSKTAGYRINFANAAQDDAKKYTKVASFGNDVKFENNDLVLINSTDKHATTVEYVYIAVNTYVDEEGEYHEGDDYVVKACDDFETIFSCYMHKPVHTWRWAKPADKKAIVNAKGQWIVDDNGDGKIGSGEDEDVTPVTSAKHGTSFSVKYDDMLGVNTYNSTKYGTWMQSLNTKEIRVVDAKITSNSTKAEDYFVRSGWGDDITFETKSGSSNPTEDVPSTLTVTYIDMFGHVQTADFDFTVQKQ